jgi:hypothetical protein
VDRPVGRTREHERILGETDPTRQRPFGHRGPVSTEHFESLGRQAHDPMLVVLGVLLVGAAVLGQPPVAANRRPLQALGGRLLEPGLDDLRDRVRARLQASVAAFDRELRELAVSLAGRALEADAALSTCARQRVESGIDP